MRHLIVADVFAFSGVCNYQILHLFCERRLLLFFYFEFQEDLAFGSVDWDCYFVDFELAAYYNVNKKGDWLRIEFRRISSKQYGTV